MAQQQQQQQPSLACPHPRRGARPDVLPRLPDDDQFAMNKGNVVDALAVLPLSCAP